MSMAEKVLAEGFEKVQEKCEFKEGLQCLKWFKEGFEKCECKEIECVRMPYIKGGR